MRYIYHVYFWYGGEHMTVPFKSEEDARQYAEYLQHTMGIRSTGIAKHDEEEGTEESI